MKNIDKASVICDVNMRCFNDYDEAGAQLIIFELVVPMAAKVPAPQRHPEVSKLLVQPAIMTSTLSSKALTQLRANNTSVGAAWCISVTLAASQPASPY